MSNIKRNLDDIVQECGEVGRKINPQQTQKTIGLHLLSEVVEMLKVIGDVDIEEIAWTVNDAWQKEPTNKLPKELADVAILTFNLASYSAIELAVWVHIVTIDNKARSWGRPNKQGYVEHLKIVGKE